jgi:hypothetical protein
MEVPTMISLQKPVRRRLENTTFQGRRLIAEFRPGLTETIFIREEGRRRGYTVPFSKIFALGANIEADAARKERAAKKKLRKQEGKR